MVSSHCGGGKLAIYDLKNMSAEDLVRKMKRKKLLHVKS